MVVPVLDVINVATFSCLITIVALYVSDLEVNQSAMEMDQMISDENVTLTIRLIMLGKVSATLRYISWQLLFFHFSLSNDRGFMAIRCLPCRV